MDKLKTCPFCGEKTAIIVPFHSRYMATGDTIGNVTVHCNNFNCIAFSLKAYFFTAQEAIEAWNTRKGEEK